MSRNEAENHSGLSLRLKIAALCSAVFLLLLSGFLFGVLSAKKHVWPAAHVNEAYRILRSYWHLGGVYPANSIRHAAAAWSREPFRVHQASKMPEGYFALLRWDSAHFGYVAELFDHQGRSIHVWKLSYYDYDPDGPSNERTEAQALALLPDGSLITSFNYGDVMLRLDSCARPLWIREGVYHHAISRDDDGSYWTIEGVGGSHVHYHYFLNFDPRDGSTIRRLGLVEDVIEKHGLHTHFRLPASQQLVHMRRDPPNRHQDLFHPNDVEPLSEALAPAFPQFEAGDLLVSFKHRDMLAVLDRQSGALKWSITGPFYHQHDPDFSADGTILVFNNNFTYGPTSNILRIDPRNNHVRELFPDARAETRFASRYQSLQQELPGGQLLVLSSNEGRLLLLDEKGKLILEMQNVVDERFNGNISNAVWLPKDFFDVVPSCAER